MDDEFGTCSVCGQRKDTADGCYDWFMYEDLTGDRYPAVRVGDEDRGDFCKGQCPECGAKEGHVHHHECRTEVCPYCGELLNVGNHQHTQVTAEFRHRSDLPLPVTSKVRCCLNCKHSRNIVAYVWDKIRWACYLDQAKNLELAELLEQNRLRGDGLFVCSHWDPKPVD